VAKCGEFILNLRFSWWFILSFCFEIPVCVKLKNNEQISTKFDINGKTLEDIPNLYFQDFEVFTAMIQKVPSSGMWNRVGLVKFDVSEKHVASIFRVEETA
jgi:hypothetical protein